jgi:hypothetical protein
MLSPSFVGYVGEADIHDGIILDVAQRPGTILVRVRGASGKTYEVEFTGVQAVRARRPEGMMLYALSEFSGEPPVRRFVFTNWDGDSEAYLEVNAESVSIRGE